MAGVYLEISCCGELTKLPLDERQIEKDGCEYADYCPVGKLRMRVRGAKGVLARADCECGGKNAGLIRYEEAES